MDSPRSEKTGTRFSTPVSDLDDHRFQPSSLPRADTIRSTGGRQGTAASHMSYEPAPTSPGGAGIGEALLQIPGSNSRDFEQAIIDYDEDVPSTNEQVPGIAIDGASDVAVSIRPSVARRATLRPGPNAENTGRSRASSKSSRSTSPPNSVDAFAEARRRDRANTIDSKAASDIDLCLQRTISGGTHRRRPTFGEGGVTHPDPANDAGSKRDSVEEDVCFPPPEETSNTCPIDFEVLEEFIAEQGRDRTPVHTQAHHVDSRCARLSSPRVFNDLRPKLQRGRVGKAVVEQPKLGHEILLDQDGNKYVENEKEPDVQSLKSCCSTHKHSALESNRFSFFSSELDATIHAADLGDLIMPGESFRDLFQLSPDGGVWWLDVLNPTEEETNVLAKAFAIHPLTSEDIKTQETREKVELFKQYYFVCFRSFFQMDKTSEDYMEPVNVYLVVFREGVLTFTFCQSPHAANVRRRIGKLRDYVALSSDWICYALIDDIVDTFGPVIHEIEQESDTIEDQVFVSRADDFNSLLRQIGECRKKVMGLMRLLGGKADVIKGFAKRCNEHYSVTPRGEIGLYLGDIQDHVVTMMSNLGHSEKMLSRSHSNYLAQLSVDSIAQGNRANEVLSKITLIATILVPLNLICGLFGMNVPVPGKESDDLRWFFGILGVIGAIVVFSLLFAKKYKFI